MNRFEVLSAESLEALAELLNAQLTTSYYTITHIQERGKGFAALIDRMPVELVTLNSFANDAAYETPEMA